MKPIPFLLLFLVLIGCNSPPIEPIDDKPPTEYTAPKEKQPDEKPVERREPPPIDKREVVPEDGGNEQTPDKTIPSCGNKITGINGTGSARLPSGVPSEYSGASQAKNRLRELLVVTGNGFNQVEKVEIVVNGTNVKLEIVKKQDTEMTLKLTTALKLTKKTLYTLLFFFSTTPVCFANVYILQGEGFTKEQQQAVETIKAQQKQITALLQIMKVGTLQSKTLTINSSDVVIQANNFKVMNTAGNKAVVSVDTTNDGSIDFKAKTIVADVGSLKVAFGGKDYFKVDTDAKKANFDGLNVQITNGTNQTDSTNGVGNLIIGYNETRSSTKATDRNGSHYLILGTGAHYTGYAGIVAGKDNTVKGNYSSILGGQENVILDDSGGTPVHPDYVVVVGGQSNKAIANYSAVVGGQSNKAIANYSAVVGGLSNEAVSGYSTVVGGEKCKAQGDYSSVLGGNAAKTSSNSKHQTNP